MGNKIKNFTDLEAWKHGHKLTLMIYRATKTFPKDEKYGLTSQIRRSAISITSNLAEGFSRQGKKEKLQFYFTSKGSLTELQNQLIISKDIQYISPTLFKNLFDLSETVHKLLNGLVRSLKT